MHRQTALSLLLLALILTLPAAAAAPRAPGPSPADGATPSALAFELESLPFAEEWSEVLLQVHRDGVQVHEERFQARRDSRDGTTLVELMGRFPSQRALLVEMDRRGVAHVEITVTVDDLVTRTFRPGDLLLTEASRAGESTSFADLRFGDSAASGGESDIRHIFAAGTDCSARNACLNDCNDQYWDCQRNATCGLRIDCPECVQLEQDCIANCPGCTCVDPKSVTTETRTYLVGTYYYGWSCLNTVFGSPYYHDDIQYNYREDTVEVTEYCNGSTSETVISSRYFSYRCWSNTYIPCSFPWSTAWNSC